MASSKILCSPTVVMLLSVVGINASFKKQRMERSNKPEFSVGEWDIRYKSSTDSSF